jgi:hypothetical protein
MNYVNYENSALSHTFSGFGALQFKMDAILFWNMKTWEKPKVRVVKGQI